MGIKEFCLLNLEKSNLAQVVLKSQNHESDSTLTARETTPDQAKQPVFDLEAEDNIVELPVRENISDYFIKVNLMSKGVDHEKQSDTTISFGVVEIELSDHFLNRIIETIVVDFPQSPYLPSHHD